MPDRQLLLEQLNQAITAQHWGRCAETCFQLLYGLPCELPLNLAVVMIRRYLPIFEATWPTVIWPSQILHDPSIWLTEHGRTFPHSPETDDRATAAFRSCFSGLLLAYSYPDDPFTLTSACCYAINEAINAHQTHVWRTADPTAYQRWTENDFSLWPDRAPHTNPAVIATRGQVWQTIADWLHKQDVGRYPVIADAQPALQRWLRNEMLITVPE